MSVREQGKKFNTGKTCVISENKEKYISFNTNVVEDRYVNNSGEVKGKKIQLRFIDSIRFMASSLDSLELLIRKGVYLYGTCEAGISLKK